MTQEIWSALAKFAKEVRGEAPLMFSGWGLSETAPSATQTHQPVDRPGNIGVPLPEVTLKLIPDEDGRCELRLKGPNVFKGYYRDPEKSQEAFDDEGFFITNDAVKFVDSNDANAGLSFDGRIAEDFKLMSGTWVRATNIRLEALKHFADIALDVVVTGHDRNEIGLLVFPHPGSMNDTVVSAGDTSGAFERRCRTPADPAPPRRHGETAATVHRPVWRAPSCLQRTSPLNERRRTHRQGQHQRPQGADAPQGVVETALRQHRSRGRALVRN